MTTLNINRRDVTFDPIASVVMHPRCMNRYQEASPRQTDAAIRHQRPVLRGKDGHGDPSLPRQTCHQATNTAGGAVPGAANWHLAPLSVKWEGLTKEQICEQIKDTARNGNRRTGKDVVEHVKVDPLILWGWMPEALEALVRAAMP